MVPWKVTRIWVLFCVIAVGPALAETAITDADYAPIDPQAAILGQHLFYDPILSGNRNISCATCHHPNLATGDGLSLGIGEGGQGLGPNRAAQPDNTPEQRIPRHSPALFNLGAKEFTVLFHDGRIEEDSSRPTGLRTPMGEDMEQGFDSLLSAQTMFPVLSPDEMAGHYSENDVSKAVRTGQITGQGGAWDILAQRVSSLPEYVEMFESAYPQNSEIKFTDISNAIAAFIAFEWRSDAAPYDAFLRGQGTLSDGALRGKATFEEKCMSCHSGPFFTDHEFHAVGQPQFGPGKAARFESHSRDTGRMRVTGNPDDAFAFRTPSLRNVFQTAPYGHTGAYPDLTRFLQSHRSGPPALLEYDRALAILPDLPVSDWALLDDLQEVQAIADAAVTLPFVTDDEIVEMIHFLQTLSDPIALSGRLGVPKSVPSGLAIDR